MGWARWSAEEYITKYEKDKNQKREDEHEHDIAPIRQEWSVWSFSRDHVCQVQHVTQRPSSFAVPNLLDEVNVFPGFISESVPVFQQGYDIGT